MSYRLFIKFAAMLTLIQTGCSAGFRVGGERGVGAGAAIGTAPSPYSLSIPAATDPLLDTPPPAAPAIPSPR